MISALAQSPGPAMEAMQHEWPQAKAYNLLDDSLASDFARIGAITPAIHERFRQLSDYAAASTDGVSPTRGILFTCSAFRPAIEAVKARLTIPVVTPNEGAFDEALELCKGRPDGGRIGLLLSFAGSAAPLTSEFHAMADAINQPRPGVIPVIAEGALEALQAGDAQAHDMLAARAVRDLPQVDAIIVGQFSLARVAPLVSAERAEPVLTTPHMAVRKLRRLVSAVT